MPFSRNVRPLSKRKGQKLALRLIRAGYFARNDSKRHLENEERIRGIMRWKAQPCGSSTPNFYAVTALSISLDHDK